MESSKETGCQAPEGPKLCINNCGFFGSATTQNMCSKCHNDMQLKQQQVKLAASSIENIVTGGSSSNEKATVLADATCVQAAPIELKEAPKQSSSELVNAEKKGPSRCAACSKRVGLIGFKCKCGDLFCSSHRYAEKHACTFDYKTGVREAIAKANPIVKAEKLEKI